MWVPLVESEDVYFRIFSVQTGYGMPKYRGSPMVGGSFWGRLITFAKGIFSKAAPHVSDMINRAQPVMKGMAAKAVESAIDSAVHHVTEKLKQTQTGHGIKGRSKRKKPLKKKATKKGSARLPDCF